MNASLNRKDKMHISFFSPETLHQTILTMKIGDWGEQFLLVNSGCSSGKWLPRIEPVEVNNVNMAIATAQKCSNGAALGFSQIAVHAKYRQTCNLPLLTTIFLFSLYFSTANSNACFEFRHFLHNLTKYMMRLK